MAIVRESTHFLMGYEIHELVLALGACGRYVVMLISAFSIFLDLLSHVSLI